MSSNRHAGVTGESYAPRTVRAGPGTYPGDTEIDPMRRTLAMILVGSVALLGALGPAAAAASVAPAPSVRRKSRRPTADLRSFFMRSSPVCSFRQHKCLRLDIHEYPAKRSDAPVKIGGLRAFEIGEETPDPGGEVLLEQLALGARGRVEASPRKA